MNTRILGTVKRGKNRGKLLGFPTANMAVDKTIPNGIYISKTNIDAQKYPSLTFIGKAETFGEKEVSVETYILDFDEDLYDRTIEIELIKKIRENEKFNSEEELIEQMKKDEESAREFFGLTS